VILKVLILTEIKKNFNINIKENVNASEISNIISTFPKFKNNGLNDEITNLKYSLQNYLYAIDANNSTGKTEHLKASKNHTKKFKSKDRVLAKMMTKFSTDIW
jgi:hypothetical protein